MSFAPRTAKRLLIVVGLLAFFVALAVVRVVVDEMTKLAPFISGRDSINATPPEPGFLGKVRNWIGF